MRGTTRFLSLRRRLIADLMHASAGVPFVTLRRTLSIGPLLDARDSVLQPAGWAAIFAKAFAMAARDEPALRTLYLKWPWPRLCEMRTSVGLVAIARHDDGEHSVLFQKVTDIDILYLSETDRRIRFTKTAAVDDVTYFRKLLGISALPLPLRRLLWGFALNNGRQRANYAGTFGVTSVAAFGDGELHALSPGPYLLSYGAVTKERTIDVVIRWDHRVTDGALIAKTVGRLQDILNTEIANELRDLYPASLPGLRIAAT
jgi:hypothetical protein